VLVDEMIVATSISKVRETINNVKQKNKLIGFVPTMGALHQGHLSLVRKAKKETDFVVVSIFVNPTQFGENEDYNSYPRHFKRDKEILKQEKVDMVFYPSVRTMYPEDFSVYVKETSLSKYLCGKTRKGHFQGVCTVVTKLFNIVQPHISYFGQKDYQQAQIVKRLVRDLNFPIKIKVLPIVRERSGLAMSSRNNYLTQEERERASYLFRGLKLGEELIKKGEKDAHLITEEMRRFINKHVSSKIDYINIVDPYTLKDVDIIEGKVLIALAVYVGKARLIDNLIVNPGGSRKSSIKGKGRRFF